MVHMMLPGEVIDLCEVVAVKSEEDFQLSEVIAESGLAATTMGWTVG